MLRQSHYRRSHTHKQAVLRSRKGQQQSLDVLCFWFQCYFLKFIAVIVYLKNRKFSIAGTRNLMSRKNEKHHIIKDVEAGSIAEQIELSSIPRIIIPAAAIAITAYCFGVNFSFKIILAQRRTKFRRRTSSHQWKTDCRCIWLSLSDAGRTFYFACSKTIRRRRFYLKLLPQTGCLTFCSAVRGSSYEWKYWLEKVYKNRFVPHFLGAGIPIPKADYYEGYQQIENGVGMVRSLMDEVEETLKQLSGDNKKRELSLPQSHSMILQ